MLAQTWVVPWVDSKLPRKRGGLLKDGIADGVHYLLGDEVKQLYIPRPASEEELLCRSRTLSGRKIGALALDAGLATPASLRRNKGWIGMLLESYLGASGGSRPQQDFPQLGIELKSIPVDLQGRPLETTFVCLANLLRQQGISWRASLVWRKLQRVLWIPIEWHRDLPLAQRRVGHPLLWSPSLAEEAELRQDWEELTELIALGMVGQITAEYGEALQLRPKAANGLARTPAIGRKGEKIVTMPRGFYLRTTFTARLLANYFNQTQCW